MRKKFGKQLGFVMVLLLLAAAAGAVLSTPKRVEARGFRWARWEIEVTFPNNTVEALLWITVGYTDNSGQEHIHDVKDFPIPCSIEGNLILTDEKAIFNGVDSYLDCDVPSIQQKVSEMTQGTLSIPGAVIAERPYFAADIELDKSAKQPFLPNPLFYRDDIAISVPMDVTNTKATVRTMFSGIAAESASFLLNSTGAHTVGMLYDQAGAQYHPFSLVDGVVTPATPDPLPGPLALSTLASKIYIGYHPITGKYFQGSLASLEIDPVCTGSG